MTLWEALLGLLQFFWPIRIVRDGEQGVRFFQGRAEAPRRLTPNPLPPGWYVVLFPPWLWQWECRSIYPPPLDLIPQSVTTKDGRQLTISANIEIEVVDLRLALTRSEDWMVSMGRMASGHIHGRVHDWTRDECLGQLRELERSVKGTLDRKAQDLGLRVNDVRLTDGVEARNIRLFNEQL